MDLGAYHVERFRCVGFWVALDFDVESTQGHELIHLHLGANALHLRHRLLRPPLHLRLVRTNVSLLRHPTPPALVTPPSLIVVGGRTQVRRKRRGHSPRGLTPTVTQVRIAPSVRGGRVRRGRRAGGARRGRRVRRAYPGMMRRRGAVVRVMRRISRRRRRGHGRRRGSSPVVRSVVGRRRRHARGPVRGVRRRRHARRRRRAGRWRIAFHVRRGGRGGSGVVTPAAVRVLLLLLRARRRRSPSTAVGRSSSAAGMGRRGAGSRRRRTVTRRIRRVVRVRRVVAFRVRIFGMSGLASVLLLLVVVLLFPWRSRAAIGTRVGVVGGPRSWRGSAVTRMVAPLGVTWRWSVSVMAVVGWGVLRAVVSWRRLLALR